MALPVKYTHSELPGAPVVSGLPGSRIAMFDAVLCNGWGLLTAQSASVSGGVCTLNFATSHAFEPNIVALVAGAGTAAINGEQRISATSSNSVSFAAPGVADGPVSGTITIKVAPAGWEKVYSGTNKAAYRSLAPDSTRAFLRVDDTNARYARLRGYATMTDIDTGTNPTPSDDQLAGGVYLPASSSADATGRRWIVVASDRFVHIAIAHYSGYQFDYALVSAGDFPSLKSGDAYRWMIVGEPSDNSTSALPGVYNSLLAHAGSTGAYIMRGYTQTGGAIPAYLYKPGFAVSAYSGSTSHPIGPNPINNAIEICPTLVLEGSSASGNRRGEIPGLYGIPHNLGSGFDSKSRITAAIGLPGHTLLAVRFYGGSSAASSYRFALDITGPWE